MGRPRKRRLAEVPEQSGHDTSNQRLIRPSSHITHPTPNNAFPEASHVESLDIFNLGMGVPDFENPVPIDPILTEAMELAPFQDYSAPRTVSQETVQDATNSMATTMKDGRQACHFALSMLPPLNFSTTPSSSPRPQTFAEHLNTPIDNHIHGTERVTSCSCLASIYLALASLQPFPQDIASALTAVRSAANTAHTCLQCPTCSFVIPREINPPIEAFQNTMMLGTILPTIAHGYKRLLRMVDCETEVAQQAGSKKRFDFANYGVLLNSSTDCGEFSPWAKQDLEPAEWRANVRKLLRADVYGYEGFTKGIRGIVEEMEQRQRSRHDALDTLALSGVDISPNRYCPDEKDRTCLRILDTAKAAIDDLVIA